MKKLRGELIRQTIHFSGILFVILSYFVSFSSLLYILLVTMIISILFLPIKRKFNISFLDRFIRKEEKDKLFLKGTVFFLLGLIFVLLLTNSVEIFRVSALVLILGDSFSTIIGKTVGNKHLPYNKRKTFEGTFAFFIFAFIGASTQIPYFYALIISLFAAFVESLPIKIDDNLSIPVLVGVLLWFL